MTPRRRYQANTFVLSGITDISASTAGILAAAMANRGGAGNNRGRGPPLGGRGGRRWDDGPNPSRPHFEQGGPSGTHEQDGDGDRQANTNVYCDGVFRAGDVRPNSYGGGNRNPSFRPNNGAGDGRRNFGGNVGGYNNRRFSNNNYGGRYESNRNSYNGGGLSAREQMLVKETAEALARQFVDRPTQREPLNSSIISSQPAAQNSREVIRPNHNTAARQSYVPKVVSDSAQITIASNIQQDQVMEQSPIDASNIQAEFDDQGRSVTSDGGSDAGGALQESRRRVALLAIGVKNPGIA